VQHCSVPLQVALSLLVKTVQLGSAPGSKKRL
jgi:hypothetical protein